MSDIIELIDGAIAGSTSRDAMRWTPEPVAAPIAFRPFTDEEIALARERLNADFTQLGEGLRAFAAGMKPVFEAMGEAIRHAYTAMQPILEARTEHRRQLHRAYRQRALARRRRSR